MQKNNDLTTQEMTPTPCINPECKRLLECNTGRRGDVVKPEQAFSICAFCGNLAVFTKDGSLRRCSKQELKSAKNTPDIGNLVQHVRRFLKSEKARTN